MKKAIPYITKLKFFCVILVILGHTIQYTYTSNFDDNILFRWIYAFHMPLFIFISGFLLNFSRKENFITNRIKTLFIPFVLWAVFYCFYYYNSSSDISLYIAQFFSGIIKSPDNGGLWFLWVLLICNVLYYPFYSNRHKYCYYILILLLLNVIYFVPHTHIMGLGLIRWYFLFFIFGLYVGEHWSNEIKFQNVVLIASLLLSIYFVCNFKRNGVISNLHGKEFLLQMTYNLLAAISSIVFFFLLFKLYFNTTTSKVKWIADQSMGYYATQFLVFTYSKTLFLSITTNLFVVAILSFFTAFSVSSLLVFFIQKSKILRKYLLGQFH